MNLNLLIRKGYFPFEITPNFSTKSLERELNNIQPNLNSFDPIDTLSSSGRINKPRRKKISKCVNFTIPKVGSHRRRIGIPNPLHQIRLSKTIADNWVDITNYTNQSSLSITRLRTNNQNKGRSLDELSFGDIESEKVKQSVDANYLLKMDIANFYGTIYTHSIPWALHTKSTSKAQRNRVHLFGNAIDKDSSKIQDGQTMGVPIGPDTSRVISEIIATAIDIEIQNKFPNIKGLRLVDDYYLYFNKLGDLETIDSLIQRVLKEYELDPNYRKHAVIKMPETIQRSWSRILRKTRFSNTPSTQRSDLISFFDKSFKYSLKYPEDYVLRYAASRIRQIVIHKSNLDLLEALLLKTINYESKTIPFVAETLVAYYSVSPTLINLVQLQESLNVLLLKHLELHNSFEIFWIIWCLKRFDLKMSKKCAKKVSKINNSIIAIEALALRNQNGIPKGLNTSLWESNLNPKGLYEEHWLLVYESIIKGWLIPSTNFISNDPFFNELKNRNVEFYDTSLDISLDKAKATELSYAILKE